VYEAAIRRYTTSMLMAIKMLMAVKRVRGKT